MARPKTRRRIKYWWLRDRHFAPVEAREFSKLTKQYPALQRLVKQRSAQWASFSRRSTNQGWSDWKKGKEWVASLKKFYAEERYKVTTDRKTGLSERALTNWLVTKDVHGRPVQLKPSPWEWYDAVFQGLPEEDQRDTPRSHRAKGGQGEVKIAKVQAQRWIADLKKSIQKTDDPELKAQFRQQIANLRRSAR